MVAGPWEVDGALKSPTQAEVAPTTAFPDPGRLSVLVRGETIATLAADHHFVAGFVSGRATRHHLAGSPVPPRAPRFSITGCFAFPARKRPPTLPRPWPHPTWPPSARATCRRPGCHPRHPTRWPMWHRCREVLKPKPSPPTAPTYFPVRRLQESADAVADMIAKALDLQGPMADHFQATPLDHLATLPADPTGLLAHTVPATDPGVNQAAVYGAHGSLHFRADPVATVAMYNDAGITHVAAERTTVYEAVDATGAQRPPTGSYAWTCPSCATTPHPASTGCPRRAALTADPTSPTWEPYATCASPPPTATHSKPLPPKSSKPTRSSPPNT